MKKKVVVIGSGFGGLAAACRLAARGHLVDVFEKRNLPGGNAAGMLMRDFHFDSGPTFLTMPFILDELFSIMGKQRQDYFELLPLDPQLQVLNHRKQRFIFSNTEKNLTEEINRWQPASNIKIQEYLAATSSMFSFWYPFSQIPMPTIIDALTIVPDLLRMKAYQDIFSQTTQYFDHPFLRQVFSFYPIFLGGSPFTTPAIYSLIQHAVHEWGLWYPSGGIYTLVNSLVSLLEEMGGKIHLNDEVTEILAHHERATSIRLADGRIISCDIVVCNSHPQYTYHRLLPFSKRRSLARIPGQRLKFGLSPFIILLGTRRRYLDGGLFQHNIIIGPRYKDIFKDILQRKKLPEDLIIYLHMPTCNDSSLAPEGHEIIYVLTPVPNLQANIDWVNTGHYYRDRIINFLEEHYLPDLRSNIVVEHYNTPIYFQKELYCPFGTPFSYTPILKQSGWFRPCNKSDELGNLYFVGSGTHPGSGIPAVLTSAKIVDDLIDGSG